MIKKFLWLSPLLSLTFEASATKQTFFLPREEEKNRDPARKRKRQQEWKVVRGKALEAARKKRANALETFKKKIEERHEEFKRYQEEKKRGGTTTYSNGHPSRKKKRSGKYKTEQLQEKKH